MMRNLVGDKFFWKCVYCGMALSKKTLVVDHAWPRSRGGGDHISNFAASCWQCNSKKGDLSFDEYLLKQRIIHQDFNYYFPGIPPEIRGPKRDWLHVQSEEYAVTADWQTEILDGYEIENIGGDETISLQDTWHGVPIPENWRWRD